MPFRCIAPCSRTYSYTRTLEASECVSLVPGKSYLLVKPGVTGLVAWTTLFYSLDRLLLMVHTHACSVAQSLSRVRLFVTPWTVARQAPLSMGFSRQEYCSGLPCPPPRDLPDPGIQTHVSYSMKVLHALAGEFSTTSATWEAP